MSMPNVDYELVHSLIREGLSINDIHIRTGISLSYLQKNYSCFYKKPEVTKLGHKDEPYYKTEKEMLQEKVYTYESLSPSEKLIYDEMAGDN